MKSAERIKYLIDELAKESSFMMVYLGDHQKNIWDVRKGSKAFLMLNAEILYNDIRRDVEEGDLLKDYKPVVNLKER